MCSSELPRCFDWCGLCRNSRPTWLLGVCIDVRGYWISMMYRWYQSISMLSIYINDINHMNDSVLCDTHTHTHTHKTHNIADQCPGPVGIVQQGEEMVQSEGLLGIFIFFATCWATPLSFCPWSKNDTTSGMFFTFLYVFTFGCIYHHLSFVNSSFGLLLLLSLGEVTINLNLVSTLVEYQFPENPRRW